MRKLDEDLVVYTTIATYSEKYKLTALRYTDGFHCMPNLEINNASIKENWDNEDYLKEIYKVLVLYRKRTLNEKELKFIEELKEFISEDDFEDLLLMFDKGVKLGFFEV